MQKVRGHRFKQYVYLLTFPDGKFYVGSAWDVFDRWKNGGIGYRGQRVWDVIQKYGWDNIRRDIVLYIPLSEQVGDPIQEKELELIREYDGRSYNEYGTESYHADVAAGLRKGPLCEPKVYWEVNGVTKPARDWCAEYNIGYGQVLRRMDRGLSVEQALSFPKVPNGWKKRPMEYWVECGCFKEVSIK